MTVAPSDLDPTARQAAASKRTRLAVWPHFPPATHVPTEILETVVSVVNQAFSGPTHDENFGDKKRYGSIDLFLQDLEDGGGGWVFMLHDQEVPVACAKITLQGKGMDGGKGVHDLPVVVDAARDEEGENVFWLGALGSISRGAGGILIQGIKDFLSRHCPSSPWSIKAYTVAEWGVSPTFAVPAKSPLVDWFTSQGFNVTQYSWKPPGTWQSFYGACLASLEYVHTPPQITQV